LKAKPTGVRCRLTGGEKSKEEKTHTSEKRQRKLSSQRSFGVFCPLKVYLEERKRELRLLSSTVTNNVCTKAQRTLARGHG